MEVLMARFSRSRTSRTVVSVVVVAITIGAAFQFHRLRKSGAQVPPLEISAGQPSAITTVAKPAPAPTIAQSQSPAIAPLVTQTPDPSKPVQIPSMMAQAPAPPTAVTPASPQASPVSPAKASTAILASYTPTTPGTLFSDASAKVTAGDLIGARTLLNSALLSGTLSLADTDAVKKQIAEINQTVIFSPRQFPSDPLGGVYRVKSGDRLSSIGNAHETPYELLLSLNRMTDARKLRYGQTLKVINGPFHAIVTKSKFTLDVYLGSPGGPDSTYITTFIVGLGTDNSTPTGTWAIRNKVTHPAYFPPEGHSGPVLAPDDPKNPLGAYWMGLEGTDGQAVGQRSYGIHGTIDPTSVGKQSSMGCIRLRNEDVAVLYKMLMQGKSTVIVRD
jgi:LysM repeat protein